MDKTQEEWLLQPWEGGAGEAWKCEVGHLFRNSQSGQYMLASRRRGKGKEGSEWPQHGCSATGFAFYPAGQWFSQLSLYQKSPGRIIKTDLWDHPLSFSFRGSKIRP